MVLDGCIAGGCNLLAVLLPEDIASCSAVTFLLKAVLFESGYVGWMGSSGEGSKLSILMPDMMGSKDINEAFSAHSRRRRKYLKQGRQR